jgi:hypothetical protein
MMMSSNVLLMSPLKLLKNLEILILLVLEFHDHISKIKPPFGGPRRFAAALAPQRGGRGACRRFAAALPFGESRRDNVAGASALVTVSSCRGGKCSRDSVFMSRPGGARLVRPNATKRRALADGGPWALHPRWRASATLRMAARRPGGPPCAIVGPPPPTWPPPPCSALPPPCTSQGGAPGKAPLAQGRAGRVGGGGPCSYNVPAPLMCPRSGQGAGAIRRGTRPRGWLPRRGAPPPRPAPWGGRGLRPRRHEKLSCRQRWVVAFPRPFLVERMLDARPSAPQATPAAAPLPCALRSPPAPPKGGGRAQPANRSCV